MSKASRPRRLPGATYEIKTGCGEVYVTCNDGEDGNLFEVFIKLGKSGGCGSATMEGLGRVASVGLRSGANPADISKTLGGIQCHKSPSCLDAVSSAIREHEIVKANKGGQVGVALMEHFVMANIDSLAQRRIWIDPEKDKEAMRIAEKNGVFSKKDADS